MEHKTQNTKERFHNKKADIASSFCNVFQIPNSKFQILNSTRRGISLLELLIYVSILSGLMVVISDAFISLSKGRGQSEARSEVNSTIRFANDIIKQDVKNASAVLVPLLGAPSSVLSLTVEGLPVVYDTSGGVLRRTVGVAGVPEEVSGGSVAVDIPVFTRLENFNPNVGTLGATTTTVQIVMTMRYNASSTDWVYSDTLRTTVTLR